MNLIEELACEIPDEESSSTPEDPFGENETPLCTRAQTAPLPKDFDQPSLEPRPTWMHDARLLPKRPPGKR